MVKNATIKKRELDGLTRRVSSLENEVAALKTALNAQELNALLTKAYDRRLGVDREELVKMAACLS